MKKKKPYTEPELKWIVMSNDIEIISSSYTRDPGQDPLEPDIIEQEEGTDIFWNGKN